MFAESCVFGKQSLPPFLCNLSRLRLYAYTYQRPTFFRSYGGNLPSSLEESSLKRLRIFSSPTCVGLRYGHPVVSLRDFSWKRGIDDLPLAGRHGISGIAAAPLIVRDTPTSLNQYNHHLARLAFSVLPQFNDYKMAQEY